MKIISGRAKTGKSTYIYDEIKKEIDKNTGTNLILLVPDMMTYQTEYDIIQRLNSEGIMDVEILSFKRFALKILEEVGGINTTDINSFGKIMLLKQLFEENADDLKLYRKSSNQEGFLNEFNQLLQELKQNLVDIDSLSAVKDSTENYFLAGKLSDIELIYSKYIEKTKDKFVDEEDKFGLAISMISKSKYIENSKIWIDGFESFTQQRIKFIKGLVDYSISVSLSLNIDSDYLSDIEAFDDFEAFRTIYETYELIKREIKDIEIVSLTEANIPSDEIKLIEKNLFSLSVDNVYEETEKINIYSSMNPYTEVEKTAIKIVGLVRDQGYRWKDIGVAVNDIDNYEINIKKIFNKYDIPYFLDVKRDIMNHPLSKYILSLLDIFIWNFKYDNVFEFLKTGFSPMEDRQIASLENYALRYGIEESKWFEEFETDEEGKVSFNEELRKLFIKDFTGKIKEFRNLSTIGEVTRFIFGYLEKHKVQQKIQNTIDGFIQESRYQESSEYSQVWNYVMEIFEQLLLVGEDTKISLLEYRRILESGLKEVKVSIIPPTIDEIQIGDIDRISTGHPKALFIMGANEGKLDSSSEKGLLLDEEREVLIENNMHILNGSTFVYYKGIHMLYKAFSSPKERLFISYSQGTVDGKSLQPSLYISSLKRLFPNIIEETDISGFNEIDYVSNHKGTYDILVENIRKHMEGNKVGRIWKDVYTWYKNNDPDRFKIIDNGFNYKNNVEPLKSEIMDNIYQDNITITVSKLETYAECPYKYFVENILKPKPRLTQKVEMYDLGNISHGVLEIFFNKLIDQPDRINDLTPHDVKTMVDDSIEKLLENQVKETSALDANNRNRYLKKKIQRTLYRTTDTLVKQLQRSEFRPRYTELYIGKIDDKGKSIDSVNIESLERIVKLRGKIDRVDVFENVEGEIYINIIDYKSSLQDISLSDASEGIQMQLLVYLNAIIKNGDKLFGKKPKIGGVFYYHIDDPIIKKDIENPEDEIFVELKLKGYALNDKYILYKMDKQLSSKAEVIPVRVKKDGELYAGAKVLTENEFDGILSFIENKCKEITRNIMKGIFDINPYKKSNITPCEYCDYLSICQFDKSTGNNHRLIKNKNNNELLQEILKEGGKEDELDQGAEAYN